MTIRDRWLLPDGIEELLPAQAERAEQLRRQILDQFKCWGYRLVMPPLVEFADSLLVGVGEDLATHSFRLTDQLSGKMLAIRPDITAQVARIDAHSMKASGVNRLCYAGSVLHAQPKSLAASRCPILAGAEIYGARSIQADIEIVSLMLATLESIADGSSAVAELTLDIGHVGVYRAIEGELIKRCPALSADGLAKIFDAIQRKSLPDLQAIVPELVADRDIADVLLALPELCGGVEQLSIARSRLVLLGDAVLKALEEVEQLARAVAERFPSVNLYLDLSELRGYEYHTGLVFAAYSAGFGSALANGGRYDELGSVFGAARAATGFNTDVKALTQLLAIDESTADIIAAPYLETEDSSGRQLSAELWRKVKQLRGEGQVVVFAEPESLDDFKQKLVYSDNGWQLG